MKNKLMLALSALIVLFSTYSCSNEFEHGKDSGDVIYRTYRSSFSDNTKTSVQEDGTVDWMKGDIIRYYSSNGGEIGMFSIEEDSHSSVINVKMSKNDDYLVAVYGGQSIEDNTKNGFTLTGVAESVQDGSFQSAHVSVARTTDVTSEQLSFSTIVGIIQLSISNPAVKYVRFTANDGTQISGDGEVEVSFTQQSISTQFSSSESGDCIMVEVDGAGTYYFSTLPCSVSGFTIELLGDEDLEPITTEKVLNLSAGHIVNLGTIDIMNAINPSYVPIDWSNVTLTGYSDTGNTFSMTFDGTDIPDIKEGSILSVNADTSGSIRIVTDVNISGNTATVTTIEGNLCDIFANTTLVLSTESQPSPVQTKGMDGGNVIYASPVAYIYEKNGRMYRQSLDMQTKGGALIQADLLTWEKNLDEEVLWEKSGCKLSLDESSFEIDVDLMISMNFGSRNPIAAVKETMTLYRSKALSVSSYINGDIKTSQVLGFHAKGSTEYNNTSTIRKNFFPRKTLVFTAGEVPIFVTVSADLNLDTHFDAEGEINCQTGFRDNANAQCGFNWSQNDGITLFKTCSNQFDLIRPTIEGTGRINGKLWLYPQFNLLIYSFLGPTFSIKPYLEATLEGGLHATLFGAAEDYAAWSFVSKTGIDAGAGLRLDFLGKSQQYDTPQQTLVDTVLLYRSPVKIVSYYDYEEDYKATFGISNTLPFTVKDYDGLSGDNVDTPFEQIVKFTGSSGKISKTYGICDKSGMVEVEWTPLHENDVLKATLFSAKGEIIDECEIQAAVPVTDKVSDIRGCSAIAFGKFQVFEGHKYGIKYWKDSQIDTSYVISRRDDPYCYITEDFKLTDLSPNTEYHYCAFMEFDGQVVEGETKSFTTTDILFTDGPKEAVDLGLSVKWASCNVGATSPEDFGGYYAWGETETKEAYTERNYLFSHGIDGAIGRPVPNGPPDTNRYESPYYDYLGDDISGTKYDVARVRWGGGWRMPTVAECQELVDRCDWEAVEDLGGHRAIKVTGPNGNSIYLLAGDYFDDYDDPSLWRDYWSETSGDYWSSSLEHDDEDCDDAFVLWFHFQGYGYFGTSCDWRKNGLHIRPVLDSE